MFARNWLKSKTIFSHSGGCCVVCLFQLSVFSSPLCFVQFLDSMDVCLNGSFLLLFFSCIKWIIHKISWKNERKEQTTNEQWKKYMNDRKNFMNVHFAIFFAFVASLFIYLVRCHLVMSHNAVFGTQYTRLCII